MAIDPSLKTHEIIAAAIRSEIDAAAFYAGLQGRVQNTILVAKLKFLALEERHHRQILERLFADRFAGEKLDVPAHSPIPPIGEGLGDSPTVPDLFKAALRAEEISEEVYDEAGKRTEDAGNRKILSYLSRVERSHAAMIRSEIDLLDRYPDYYQVEDFHFGQDFIHVGP
ncbi:MAG: ferritin-like domain-containing protein [Candidatus Aminicenantales bacterium]